MSMVSRFPALAFIALSICSADAGATDWLQFGFDAAHSGNNPQEAVIGQANVASMRSLWTATLPAIADGAPVFLAGVVTPIGTRDLLFLTTNSTNFIAKSVNNRLVAIDAATGAQVWATTPASGPNWTTSSPAIDPNRQYVYSYAVDGKVHKYRVGDGGEILTGGWPQLATLKPDVEKGSAALAFATARNNTTYLYVANGGYPGDAGDYQGHITAIDLTSGTQKVFNANCSDQTVHFAKSPGTPDCGQVQTAIWARPGVIYAAALDKIFMATGNGSFDAKSSTAPNHDWGDSVFALNPDGSGGANGNPLDSYTPVEFQQLQNNDADLGSTAPTILPSTIAGYPHLAAQGGKDSMLRLLDLDNLSGQGGPGHLGGELQKIPVPQGDQVLPQPAVWVDPSGTTWVFVSTLFGGVSGLTLSKSAPPALTAVWQNSTGGSSPVIANGILYYNSGSLNALDPSTGTVLWTSPALGGIHWQSPIVVNGRIFVTDQNAKLWAFEPDEIFKNGFE